MCGPCKRVATGAAVTIGGGALVFAVAAWRSMRLPGEAEDALALVCIFFAALITTLVYIPEIRHPSDPNHRRVVRALYLVVLLSAIVAIMGSVGGGIIRRWITVEATVLTQPHSPWWEPLFAGWLLGFLACLPEPEFHRRLPMLKYTLDSIDAWVMGAFAAAGAIVGARWRPWGDYSDIPFVELFWAMAFAGLTGAGGGLVARVFASLTFTYRGPRGVLDDVRNWAFTDYTKIGFGVGTFTFIAYWLIGRLVPLRVIPADVFKSESVDPTVLLADLSHPGSILHATWAKALVGTDLGIILLLYFVFGFGACYMYRTATTP